ncbi:MAG: hypothetical protein ACTHM6_07530 [Tepidisphaeraceae bacterium]
MWTKLLSCGLLSVGILTLAAGCESDQHREYGLTGTDADVNPAPLTRSNNYQPVTTPHGRMFDSTGSYYSPSDNAPAPTRSNSYNTYTPHGRM